MYDFEKYCQSIREPTKEDLLDGIPTTKALDLFFTYYKHHVDRWLRIQFLQLTHPNEKLNEPTQLIIPEPESNMYGYDIREIIQFYVDPCDDVYCVDYCGNDIRIQAYST